MKVTFVQKSDVIEVDGVFVGVAIASSDRSERLFFATHPCLRSMHKQILPSLPALKLQAQRQFHLLGALAADRDLSSPGC